MKAIFVVLILLNFTINGIQSDDCEKTGTCITEASETTLFQVCGSWSSWTCKW